MSAEHQSGRAQNSSARVLELLEWPGGIARLAAASCAAVALVEPVIGVPLTIAATALLGKVLAVGFKGSQIEPDGCGFLKVAVHGIPTQKVGGEVVAEARSVGLEATLEQAG